MNYNMPFSPLGGVADNSTAVAYLNFFTLCQPANAYHCDSSASCLVYFKCSVSQNLE